MSGVPLVMGPYSTEPVTTGPMACPPVRITYRSPSPVSKRSSGGTRESMQERIAPKGSCFSATNWRRSGSRSGCRRSPLTQRLLPSMSLVNAAAGVVGGGCGGALVADEAALVGAQPASVTVAAARPPTRRTLRSGCPALSISPDLSVHRDVCVRLDQGRLCSAVRKQDGRRTRARVTPPPMAQGPETWNGLWRSVTPGRSDAHRRHLDRRPVVRCRGHHAGPIGPVVLHGE